MNEICPRCGIKLPTEEVMFCPVCGWHLADQDYLHSQRPTVTDAGDSYYGVGWGGRDPKTRLFTPEMDTYYCWKCGTYKPLKQISNKTTCPDCGEVLRLAERHRPRLRYVIIAIGAIVISLLYVLFFRNL